MLHDPTWRAVASLALVGLAMGMLRMGGKFLADRREEAFAPQHALARGRFLAWFDLAGGLHGTLLRTLLLLALLAAIVRRAPCDLRDFPGVEAAGALFAATRFAYLGLLLGAVAAALPQFVTAVRYVVANRRGKWEDERAKHALLLSLLGAPLALLLEWLALRIVWGRECLFDPF